MFNLTFSSPILRPTLKAFFCVGILRKISDNFYWNFLYVIFIFLNVLRFLRVYWNEIWQNFIPFSHWYGNLTNVVSIKSDTKGKLIDSDQLTMFNIQNLKNMGIDKHLQYDVWNHQKVKTLGKLLRSGDSEYMQTLCRLKYNNVIMGIKYNVKLKINIWKCNVKYKIQWMIKEIFL